MTTDTQPLAPTDAELTAIYKAANGEDTGKAQPLTTQRIFRAMRAAIAKWSTPAGAGEVVAHRVMRKNLSGEWASDARDWSDGPPSRALVDSICADKGRWRIDVAYAAPAAVVGPSGDRVRECAARLVEHADFRLGGILSANSKVRDIPSRACSQVKARHLAALRDALAAAPTPPAQAADSVLEDAAQVEIDLFNDLNRIYGNTLTAYAKEMCRLGYRKTNAARKQGGEA